MKLVYVCDPSRAYKLIPLLEEYEIVLAETVWNIPKIMIQSRKDAKAIIIDSFGKYGVIGMVLSVLLRVPLIIRMRGDFFRERGEIYKSMPGMYAMLNMLIHIAIARISLRHCELIIVNSKYMKKRFNNIYSHKRIEVVYNPYTSLNNISVEAKLKLPTDGFHILSITNFHLRSKTTPLITAISNWIKPDEWETMDLYWVVCGKGILKGEFVRQVNKLGLSKRLFCIGYTDQIAALYNWANVFVHLSELDAFPNVTLEAMMHQLPVITNIQSCGTLEQVENNENGIIVDGASEFRECLLKYSNDQLLREKHGRNGRLRVERNFSIDKQKETMTQVLCSFFDKNKIENM